MNFPKSELSKQDALHLWITCRSKYAKEQMFLTNYGIVFFVMRRLGIPAFDEDMFQIGSIGLLKAIDTFDASKGCFSTYAFPIVRNELLMEFRKSKKSVNAAFSLDDNVDIGNGESVESERTTYFYYVFCGREKATRNIRSTWNFAGNGFQNY